MAAFLHALEKGAGRDRALTMLANTAADLNDVDETREMTRSLAIFWH